jgi:hypothetical protein
VNYKLTEAEAALFRRNTGEPATMLLGESVVFCFLAGGELENGESAGDEPKFNGFFGVEGCDAPLLL